MLALRKSLALLILALVVGAGCLNPNLRRLHSPDLLTIDPHQAARASHNATPPANSPTTHHSPLTTHSSVQPASYHSEIPPSANWKVHSSLSGFPALFDANPQTAAVSTSPTQVGQWIFIDLGSLCTFQTVRQIHAPPAGHPPDPSADHRAGQPAEYRIDTADDRGFPFTLQFVGTGQPATSTATFHHPVRARFLRITLLEDTARPWSVAEIEIH